MASNPFFESELFNELNDALKHSSRFTATYRIAADDYAEAKKIARGIAVEQTVECPDELFVNTWIEDSVIGQIEDLKKADPGSYYAIISYSPDTVEGEMTELMNMLFGNTSLQPGIRLMSFELPDSMYRHYPGPKFGRQGIRELCGIEKGPILMSALKPLGRSAKDFGETAYKLALGGCPLIKDDHSLFNQSYAPFKDRVKACVDSVNNANAKTGGRSLYIANCTADSMEFLERAMTAQELGAGGIMAAPGLLGLSIIRELSSAPDFHLTIFLHPCFSGPLVLSADSGISPFCCYGQFSRLAGADAAIFTSFGGRFPFTEEVCQKICDGTETEMGGLRSIFPVPSGGMKWQLFKKMVQVYGPDAIFLVGGALLTESDDLTANMHFYFEKLNEAVNK